MDELLTSTPALRSLDCTTLLYAPQSCLSRMIALTFCPFSFIPYLYMLDYLYMITGVFPHVPITHNYIIVTVFSSLPPSDSLTLASGY